MPRDFIWRRQSVVKMIEKMVVSNRVTRDAPTNHSVIVSRGPNRKKWHKKQTNRYPTLTPCPVTISEYRQAISETNRIHSSIMWCINKEKQRTATPTCRVITPRCHKSTGMTSINRHVIRRSDRQSDCQLNHMEQDVAWCINRAWRDDTSQGSRDFAGLSPFK